MKRSQVLFIGDEFNGLKEVISDCNTEKHEVIFLNDIEDTEKSTAIQRATYLLTGNVEIGEEILSQAQNTLLVQNTGVGCNNIDVDFASNVKIPVANAPGSNSVAVAELTIALILSLYRKIIFLNHSTKNGEWHMWDFRNECFELQGKTHGIIGFGDVGKEVALRSKAFGTDIYYYDKFRADQTTENNLNASYSSLDNLLKVSDIISIHIPLTIETENLINNRALKLMKKSAIIINVSRGGIVNETDLYNALIASEVAGTAIDTWKTEPIKPDNKLLKLDQVIATPHTGAGTIDTIKRVYQICFNNINRVNRGKEPNHIVNKN